MTTIVISKVGLIIIVLSLGLGCIIVRLEGRCYRDKNN